MKRNKPLRTIDLDIALPSEDHGELLVDEALLESFPASGSPAPAVDARVSRARASRSTREAVVFRQGAEGRECEPDRVPEHAVPLPAFIQIEPVGHCNLRCRMCPVQFRAPTNLLGYDEFCRLLDGFPTATRLHLQGLGEPLMHPALLRHGAPCRGEWHRGVDEYESRPDHACPGSGGRKLRAGGGERIARRGIVAALRIDSCGGVPRGAAPAARAHRDGADASQSGRALPDGSARGRPRGGEPARAAALS